jgi:hypothetical protein
MSYCRWSSNNWMCDVYVYADVSGGYTTHIARSRRAVAPIPDLPLDKVPSFGGKLSKEKREMVYPSRLHKACASLAFRAWALWHRHVHMRSLDRIPLRPIGGPYDGKTFNDDTPGQCALRLSNLKAMGYAVPQSAIDALWEEDGLQCEEERQADLVANVERQLDLLPTMPAVFNLCDPQR